MNAASTQRDVSLFRKVLRTLNEAQRRWLVGREALRHGRGGIQRMVEASGLSKPTILKGIRELRGKRKLMAEEGRVRKAGGGRKPVEMHDPEITRLLEQVMDESTVRARGIPSVRTPFRGGCGNSTTLCRLTRRTKRANRMPIATGSFVTSIGRRSAF